MTDIVLLDGGMGQELIARSQHPPTPRWSSEILEREPDLVRAVHDDFLDAGATVTTVNSYAVTPERLARLMPAPEAEALFETLQRAALDIAEGARRPGTALAGCLPPLGGSYHPEGAPDDDEMARTYARIVAHQAPRCDILLAETMSSVREARAATRAIRDADARAWIALSVRDTDGTRLRSGEPLAEGVAAVVDAGAEAILLNCSRPGAIDAGLPALAATGLPFGAYANGFEDAAELELGTTVAGMAVRDDLGPEAYAARALAWVDRGATIVGGCCEVGPAHIAALARALRAAGHRIVAP
ncbi:homocysteine S-methyltransferase family protein [Jannaschia sp. Os4]|uniref:homocysteine S-methyltransferase family protein n=1 Tax=Jannaschia sp. Os4 TaxID=2807617 RepID=UPI001939A21C|nr:homocysteine S-methyltransferase family protein [Jannaschia sp. Os4]MBM2575489.1 homocysteine S-methyltransferase family protein [Jannaschia sp. Os4]